ncbi:hypothetical protein BofuT4_P013730.1 [Botrytis cinerea T4]|uniref:Uncharacterized protein n=1 Tax=Botryotinia fuckeliana (strain T4) TaxID=999810 RepID=G2XMY9_BOTF4|nr:hypothetical protein BofuT4_P013730.1 [Botrytis cinerea T4]
MNVGTAQEASVSVIAILLSTKAIIVRFPIDCLQQPFELPRDALSEMISWIRKMAAAMGGYASIILLLLNEDKGSKIWRVRHSVVLKAAVRQGESQKTELLLDIVENTSQSNSIQSSFMRLQMADMKLSYRMLVTGFVSEALGGSP